MSKVAIFILLFTTVLVCLLPAMPAQATGAARTFLSAAGSDSNNCINVVTPCRHLATAYAATAPNGEIYVLDPANYGALTITGPVSIEGHGWASIAPVAGQPAIKINAGASDKINIIGVVLDGTNLANTTGIQFNSGGNLIVRDSVIRNFSNDGIDFFPNSSGPSQIFVANTLLSDNGGRGIGVDPAGTGTTTGALDRVQMENNGGDGLSVSGGAQNINVTVSDSVATGNGGSGISVGGGTTVSVMVRTSAIVNNGFATFSPGLFADGAGATLRVTRSTITGNFSGWLVLDGGVVLSYADNNIDTNGSGNTPPPTTGLVYK